MFSGSVEERLRRFLLLLAVTVFLAATVELVLEDHTKEALQFIPFGLCALALVALGAALLRPGRGTLRALRVAMVVVTLGGMFGAGIHLWENYQFAHDIRPNGALLDIAVATLKGAAPLLAPGVLIFGALIALLATYYHPGLKRRA